MHILISCFGSAGDVHPFMAAGQALRARGHRVELLTSAYFRERIEAVGLGFVPIGSVEDYESAIADPSLWDPRRGFASVWQAVQRSLPDAYRDLLARVQADSVLVGSTLAFNSRLVQEKTGLPGATVHLSPACIFSAHAPAVLPGAAWLSRLPPWLMRPALDAIERLFLDPVVLPGLNAFRAELGLPPVTRAMSRWLNSPQRVICAFPDWFAAQQVDWPANSMTTDFPRWDSPTGAALDPSLDAFLRSGPAPIGITAGSANSHGREVFARALSACATLGLRAVVITPWGDQLPATLPDSVRHVRYAPFDLLLPRLRAVVHHGGIGTLAQGLAAGIPQLIAPFAHDQFDNAARLRKLGVGATVAPAARVGIWTRRLRTLVESDAVADACRHSAERSRDAQPAALRLADEIERLRS